MSVTNVNKITKVILGSAEDECLLSGSNWFDRIHVGSGANQDGSYPSFVLHPYSDNDVYVASKDSALIVSARNPCYRYLQIEIADWRVEDWYRRRVTADDDSLENNYGSYDYLDIYIGRPVDDNASSYTETFWARLGGASYSTLEVAEAGNGINDKYRSYHEGTIRTVPGVDSSKKFVIDMAQAWASAANQTDDYGYPRYAYYPTGSTEATENGIDTRPVYLPTGSIAYVVFHWHTEATVTSHAGTMGRFFEITCSFHEKVSETAYIYGTTSVYAENVLQRQNPGFMQYPAVTLASSIIPGLTSSIEGDIPTSNRTGPPAICCPVDQWDDITKEVPTGFAAIARGDNCDEYGTVELVWNEATSSTGYTRYNIYIDDGTSGVNPADSSTYASALTPIWGTCFPPPNSGSGKEDHPADEPGAGWPRPGVSVGGIGNVGQTQSGSKFSISHTITGVDTSQTYKYWLQAVDVCGASSLISAEASFTTTDLTCSSPYYYDEDFTIDYYKCLHMQFNRKGAVPGQYCPPDHVPFAYGTKGVTIRYPKTPYSGNLG